MDVCFDWAEIALAEPLLWNRVRMEASDESSTEVLQLLLDIERLVMLAVATRGGGPIGRRGGTVRSGRIRG